MPSLKVNLFIAFGIGAVISAVLLVLEPLTDYAYLWLEEPGVTAAYVFWGAVGSSVVMGVAISWIVNALCYGFGAFVILMAFKLLIRPKTP